MARINKCKVCGSMDPSSGWAGTNHSLCNGCIPPKPSRSESQHEFRRTPRGVFAAGMLAAAMLAPLIGLEDKNNGR